jgi:hypothetical protein
MIYRTVSKEETKKWERGKGEEDLLNLKEERKAVNLCIFWLVQQCSTTPVCLCRQLLAAIGFQNRAIRI